jgi:hypothetical protein
MVRLAALYHDLRALGFGPIVTKEILCAAAALKVTRISVTDRDVAKLEGLLPTYGMQLTVGDTKYGVARDLGKGGWSNRFTAAVPADSADGYWKLYIAADRFVMLDARERDAAGNDNYLGDALGIPDCCRRFYDTFARLAFAKQGDLVPFTFLNTEGGYPFNFWNNSACQYFDYSLLSFSPCSFNCPKAADVARRTYEFLRDIDRDFAERFLDQHRRSVLYTEYDGVFLLIDAVYDAGTVSYRAANATSRESDVAKAIEAGNRIVLHRPNAFTIQAGSNVLKECAGSDFALCVFAESKLGTRQSGSTNQDPRRGCVV